MMTYEEQEKIERLVAKDENAQKLITALRDDYHMALSQISHEIRNPLTYIDSSVQWIQKMHPEVEHFEFWDQIKNDLQYMRVLLDDISAFNNGDKLNICKIDPVDNDHPLVTDGEYRIVMPSSSDKTKTVSEVRLYDEIIVSGQNLYDGKLL